MPEFFEHRSRSIIIKVDGDSISSADTTSDEYGLRTSLESFTVAEADKLRPQWRDDFVPISEQEYERRRSAIFDSAE